MLTPFGGISAKLRGFWVKSVNTVDEDLEDILVASVNNARIGENILRGLWSPFRARVAAGGGGWGGVLRSGWAC